MMNSTIKKSLALVLTMLMLLAAAPASAQQVIIIQPQSQNVASPCEYVSQEITSSIMEAERQGIHVEQTGRYQALRLNRQIGWVGTFISAPAGDGYGSERRKPSGRD